MFGREVTQMLRRLGGGCPQGSSRKASHPWQLSSKEIAPWVAFPLAVRSAQPTESLCATASVAALTTLEQMSPLLTAGTMGRWYPRDTTATQKGA